MQIPKQALLLRIFSRYPSPVAAVIASAVIPTVVANVFYLS
jgi:hypothetical protein